MKKIVLILIASTIVVLSSCNRYVACPAYAQQNGIDVNVSERL